MELKMTKKMKIMTNRGLRWFMKKVIEESELRKMAIANTMGITKRQLDAILRNASFSISDLHQILNAMGISIDVTVRLSDSNKGGDKMGIKLVDKITDDMSFRVFIRSVMEASGASKQEIAENLGISTKQYLGYYKKKAFTIDDANFILSAINSRVELTAKLEEISPIVV